MNSECIQQFEMQRKVNRQSFKKGGKKEQSGRFQFWEIWFELYPTFITDK